MTPLVEKAEAAIQSHMAGADAAQKRELERQASVVRFARYSLGPRPGRHRQPPAGDTVRPPHAARSGRRHATT